jgi:hypothetical protein
MSTLTLQSYIGQTALLQSDKLRFAVKIVDAKLAYGQTRLLVTPSNGTGTVWVDKTRIELVEDIKAQAAIDARFESAKEMTASQQCYTCGKHEDLHKPSAGVNRITAHKFFPEVQS